jgi:hypothetical protein
MAPVEAVLVPPLSGTEVVAKTTPTSTFGAGSKRSRNKARNSTAKPPMIASGTTHAENRLADEWSGVGWESALSDGIGVMK